MTDKSTAAVSELSGQLVNTWSDEWRHECEVSAILARSEEEREAFFYGVPGGPQQRGIVALPGTAAADQLFEDVKRLRAIRERR